MNLKPGTISSVTAAPPITRPPLEDHGAQAGAREVGAAGESVVAAAKDDGVVALGHRGSWALIRLRGKAAPNYTGRQVETWADGKVWPARGTRMSGRKPRSRRRGCRRSKARTGRACSSSVRATSGCRRRCIWPRRASDVLVVDAEAPGWGASGRNGGQVIPGLKYDPGELEAMFGRERGERIWRFAGATADFVLDLIARHGLDCGARRATVDPGRALGEGGGPRAATRGRLDEARRATSNTSTREQVAAVAGTDIYIGGFADHRGGALQPLSYARELARVALAAGLASIRGARVVALDVDGSGWRAVTAAGRDGRARRR